MTTNNEKLETVKKINFETIKTIDELRTVWRTAVGSVGHKVLGRMLLGETAEHALRID